MNLVPVLNQHVERVLALARQLPPTDADTLVAIFGRYHPGTWEGTDPRGPWFTTAHGRRLYILDPKPDEIHADDLAHALARIPRYGGHSGLVATRFTPGAAPNDEGNVVFGGGSALSVAQHSLLVAFLVEAKLLRDHGGEADTILTGEYVGSRSALVCKAMVHDGTEAFLGDVIGPLKRLFPFYKQIELNFEDALLESFGLDPMTETDRTLIKYADRLALVVERELYCWKPPAKEELVPEENLVLPDYAQRIVDYIRFVFATPAPSTFKTDPCWSYYRAQYLFRMALLRCPALASTRTALPGWTDDYVKRFGGFAL